MNGRWLRAATALLLAPADALQPALTRHRGPAGATLAERSFGGAAAEADDDGKGHAHERIAAPPDQGGARDGRAERDPMDASDKELDGRNGVEDPPADPAGANGP